MLSCLNELDCWGLFFKLNVTLTYTIIDFKKSLFKSNSFKCESTSKFGKFTKILNNSQQVKKLLFLGILQTFSVFYYFHDFWTDSAVLLNPTKYCFQDQVTTPSDRLWVVNKTFTNLDMVYSDLGKGSTKKNHWICDHDHTQQGGGARGGGHTPLGFFFNAPNLVVWLY